MAQWFKNIDADFEFRTFAHMYAFDNGIRIMYPNFCKNAETERSKFYKSENAPKLSEAFEKAYASAPNWPFWHKPISPNKV